MRALGLYLVFALLSMLLTEASSSQIVECSNFYSLKDCDPQAECVQGSLGYSSPAVQCRCPVGFTDVSPNPSTAPGRKCTKLVSKCMSQNLNDCDPMASCVDTPDSYICQCPSNYVDNSPDRSNKPGRVCAVFRQDDDQCSRCSSNAICDVDVATYSGFTCHCKPGFFDSNPAHPGTICNPASRNDRCDPGKNSCDGNAQCYTRGESDYTCVCKAGFRDRSPSPSSQPGRVCVRYTPRCYNNLNDCDTSDRAICVDNYDDTYSCRCRAGYFDASPDLPHKPGRVCKKQACSESRICGNAADCIDDGAGGYACRCKAGYEPSNYDPRNPGCLLKAIEAPPQTVKNNCGSTNCDIRLNEVCLSSGNCGCAADHGRVNSKDPCQRFIRTHLAIRISSEDGRPLLFRASDYGSVQNPRYSSLAHEFSAGIGRSLKTTSYAPQYVTTDIAKIGHPAVLNPSWTDGLLVNFTVSTLPVPGGVDACDLWKKLEDSIKATNGAIGGGRLQTARDFDLLNPCMQAVDECASSSLNTCSENARCTDLMIGYKCECNRGFLDASPEGAQGRICKPDFCYDVQHCTVNSTCINLDQGYRCECKKGFLDITMAPNHIGSTSVDDSTCLASLDADPCQLGLHNCSGIANCIRVLPFGYRCECPLGYLDGDTENPGRVCAAAVCSLCNLHGDCVHDPVTNNVTCACVDGYTGEHCELTSSQVPLIILIILALLFLLLSLCCLLYLCTKCRCFKHRHPWNALDQSVSSDSGLYHIPRAHLYDGDSLKSGSSQYTIREEIERRVTTDVTRTELRSTDAGDEQHDVIDTTRAYATRSEYYPPGRRSEFIHH